MSRGLSRRPINLYRHSSSLTLQTFILHHRFYDTRLEARIFIIIFAAIQHQVNHYREWLCFHNRLKKHKCLRKRILDLNLITIYLA